MLVVFLLSQRTDAGDDGGEEKRRLYLPLLAYLVIATILRTIQAANPDWRLLDWLLTGSAIVVILYFVWKLGGPALFRRWCFPICILLAAVPWPTVAERAVTDHASPAIASATSEILWLASMPTAADGSAIRTGAGTISVTEDCSGIRGVQLALMASLFWAAYYGLTAFRTAGFVASSLALALGLNVLRVVEITAAAVQAGKIEGAERIHDHAGIIELLLLITLIPALAQLFRTRSTPPETAAPPASTAAAWDPTVLRNLAIATALGLVVCEVSVEVWFRAHEATESSESQLAVFRRPKLIPEAAEHPMPTQVNEAYLYSDGLSCDWPGSAGGRWTLYTLYFDAGKISACTHNVHHPEVCLASHDRIFLGELPKLDVHFKDGGVLQFHHQVFRRGNSPVHLFFVSIEEAGDQLRTVSDWTYSGRLKVAWQGIRSKRSEMIHLIAESTSPEEDVRKSAADYLARIF